MQQPAPASHESARLFLALLPPDTVKAALASYSEQWRWPAGAVRYAAADWHVTLHFMGSLPRPRLDDLRAGLALPVTPFELRLAQAELWPHGLAVLCPEVVPAGLQQLHAALAQALARLGLRTDARPLRPHLTLARHAQGAQPPIERPRLDWPVAAYALMESTGAPAARYRVLQSYPAQP